MMAVTGKVTRKMGVTTRMKAMVRNTMVEVAERKVARAVNADVSIANAPILAEKHSHTKHCLSRKSLVALVWLIGSGMLALLDDFMVKYMQTAVLSRPSGTFPF